METCSNEHISTQSFICNIGLCSEVLSPYFPEKGVGLAPTFCTSHFRFRLCSQLPWCSVLLFFCHL